MGRETRNFRQSNKSRSGSQGDRIFSKVNNGKWHQRIISYFKMKGEKV